MDTVKSVKFKKVQKSPMVGKKFEKTPHSNKVARPAPIHDDDDADDGAGTRKKRKLNFSNIEDSHETSPAKPTNGLVKNVPQRQWNKPRLSYGTKRQIKRAKHEDYENTIFVGNLPAIITRADLKQSFNQFGTVLNARIRCMNLTDAQTKKKGSKAQIRKVGAIKNQVSRDYVNAYVRFASAAAAAIAVRANGVEFEGRHLRIDYADPALKKKNSPNKAVFVRSIQKDVTEDQLWDVFSQCGEIESVRIVLDSQNNYAPRGFGYVNFSSPESVQLAVDLGKAGIQFNGKPIEVIPSVPKKKNDSAGRPSMQPRVKKDKKVKAKKEPGVPEFAGKIAQPKKKKEKSDKIRKFVQ